LTEPNISTESTQQNGSSSIVIGLVIDTSQKIIGITVTVLFTRRSSKASTNITHITSTYKEISLPKPLYRGSSTMGSCRIYFNGSWGILGPKDDSTNIDHPEVINNNITLCTLDRMANCTEADLNVMFTDLPRADHKAPKDMGRFDNIPDHRTRVVESDHESFIEKWVQDECDRKAISVPVFFVVLGITVLLIFGVMSLPYLLTRLSAKMHRRYQKRLEKRYAKAKELEMKELDQASMSTGHGPTR
jgi:hypothetical protein